jgi:DNA-binding transcriptional LysR family regulator
MDDLNDLAYFTAVVRHGGFSAAARALGVEKTRVSRRVAELERRLGVQLLVRTTRSITLTNAGQSFYDHCASVVDGARSAYDSIANLRREPAGPVRMNCPQPLARSHLAPILPDYMERYPKVHLMLDTSNRPVDPLAEGYDLVLGVSPPLKDQSSLVARPMGVGQRILVASPAYLDRHGRPDRPEQLIALDWLARHQDMQDGKARWFLTGPDGGDSAMALVPRLESDDLLLQLDAALHGLGVALLPERIVATALRSKILERVLPAWCGLTYAIYLLYPGPRGLLPSVRSLIDYLGEHLAPGAPSPTMSR